MRALFGRLYYYYFYAVLALIFLPLYPVFRYLLADEKRHPKAQKLRRSWARATFLLTGMRCKVEGGKDIDLTRTYVIVANHTSHLDIPALSLAVPAYFGFLAKAELSDIPLLRIFFKTIDIEVERDRPEGGAKSYKLSVQALKSGKSLVIFPEGGIFGNPLVVNPFKEGAFKLALRQKAPILPVGLPDTHKRLPDEAKRGKPGRIHVILHDPIETTSLTDADIPALMEEIRGMFQKDIDSHENR